MINLNYSVWRQSVNPVDCPTLYFYSQNIGGTRMKKLILTMSAAALMLTLTGCNENSSVRLPLASEAESSPSSQLKETDNTEEQSSTKEQESTAKQNSAEESERAEETNSTESSSVQDNSAKQYFTSLNLEISKGTLYIRSGNSFSLTRRDGAAVDYEISDNTLYFKNSYAGDVVLTLPENDNYETLLLIAEDGHVYGESLLTAQTLDLKVAQGEVKLESVSVAGNSFIEVAHGSAFLSGNLGSSATVNCQGGHLSLEVPFAQNNYNYEIELSNGNIRLGNEQYHGRSYSHTVDNKAEHSLKLTCAQGDISVEFGKTGVK